MGSVFVNGSEQERAGQSEGSRKAALDFLRDAAAERRPDLAERRVPETYGRPVVVNVGAEYPTNYYKVASMGRQVLYLFDLSTEFEAYAMAETEARARAASVSVCYQTAHSRRRGVDPSVR